MKTLGESTAHVLLHPFLPSYHVLPGARSGAHGYQHSSCRKSQRKLWGTFFLDSFGWYRHYLSIYYIFNILCVYIYTCVFICSSILTVDLSIWKWDIQRIDLTFWGNRQFFMRFPDFATWQDKELNSGQAIILRAGAISPISWRYHRLYASGYGSHGHRYLVSFPIKSGGSFHSHVAIYQGGYH